MLVTESFSGSIKSKKSQPTRSCASPLFYFASLVSGRSGDTNVKWQGKYGRKGGRRFRLEESQEILWPWARSGPGNSVLGRRDHSVRPRAAMISPTPEEAATQRGGRREGYLLSLSKEHNPGQTVSISERPLLSLPHKGLQYIYSVLYFPHFYQRTPSKVP